MRAAQLVEYGSETGIKIRNDAPKPEVGDGQVLVEVWAAGVNPFDWKLGDGLYREFIPLEFPAILGGDCAGKVVALGQNVSGFEVGQLVYGMANATSGQGSFAEFTVVKASQLVAKPENLDFQTAAALPLAAISAWQALVDHINIQAGQKILIHGGGGGIGSLAIQIAHHIGAYVATTASDRDEAFVKNLGADEVIDFKTQDFSQLLKDYDAVFDTVGSDTNHKSYQVLKPGGAFVSMVQPVDEARAKQYSVVYTQQSTKPTRERLASITALVEKGTLKVHVDKIFPLEQTAAALMYVKTGHPRGKVVIQIKDV